MHLFVGCQIVDAVLIAKEIISSRINLGKMGIVCKLHLEKAHDYANWQFLIYMIRRMGFGERQISISSTSFAVIVN